MKFFFLIFFIFMAACSTSPHKVSQTDAAKIKTVTVVSILGGEITVQRITAAQQLTGIGQFEKDINVSSWMTDLQIESAIGKEIQESGRKYFPVKLSTSDRVELKNESQKIGNNLISKALQVASYSGAEYAIVISPSSIIRRAHSFKGNTEPILLTCSSDETLPRLAVMYRSGVWRIKDKVQFAGTSLVVEATYNGEVKCGAIAKESDKKLEESFKTAYTKAVKALATETVHNSGLIK